MKKQSRDEIRQVLIEGRSSHVVVKRVIVWCRKNAAKSWDTSAIIQLMNIYNLKIRDARSLVSELHTGKTTFSNDLNPHGFVVIPAPKMWSCDWDKKMLDIPAI